VAQLDPDSQRRDQREAATAALVRIGPAAVPVLERILAGRTDSPSEKVKGVLIRFGWVKRPLVHPLELQSRACEAAHRLAEQSLAVDITRLVPHLQYHFTNGPYADSTSGRALASAGSEGITVLTNLLFTGTRCVRDMAASSLRHWRTDPRAIAALIQSARTETDASLRANAMLYLTGSRGPADSLSALGLRGLKSDNGYERLMAANLLGDFVHRTEVATALNEALSDADERVRSAATRALRRAQ
jgi:HEAT repeat protein